MDAAFRLLGDLDSAGSEADDAAAAAAASTTQNTSQTNVGEYTCELAFRVVFRKVCWPNGQFIPLTQPLKSSTPAPKSDKTDAEGLGDGEACCLFMET